MPKILFVTHDSNFFGANRSLVNLIQGLKMYNYEFVVITGTDGELKNVLEQMGVECMVVPFTNFVGTVPKIVINRYFFNRVFKKWRSTYAIWNKNRFLVNKTWTELEKYKFDLIYSNTSVIDFGYYLSKKLQLPHVLHIREAFDLHYGWRCWYGKYYFNRVLLRSTKLIGNSNFIKKHFEDKLSRNKGIEVIYNGVFFRNDCQELPLPQPSINNYDFLLLGSLSRSKGLEDAINALSIVLQSFPNARLIIMGDGSRTMFQNLAMSLNISENVKFYNYQNDPTNVIKKSFALLNCSRNEAMGRVTVEAMLLGIPVIGFNSGGTTELIDHGQTGLLYSAGYQDLANKMKELITDKELYRSMRRKAHNYAIESFSIEVYTEKIHKVLKEII